MPIYTKKYMLKSVIINDITGILIGALMYPLYFSMLLVFSIDINFVNENPIESQIVQVSLN